MKKLIVIVSIFLIMVSSVIAKETADEICPALEKLAGKIMDLRQSGIPMSVVVGKIQRKDLFLDLVIEAYNTPKYETYKYQENAILKFKNTVYKRCVIDFQE